MKQKVILTGLLTAAILGGALWWFKLHGSTQASAEAPEKTAEETSALVTSQLVSRQSLDNSLLVFGDVATGKATAINFPQAGQISRMQVVAGQQVHRGDELALLTTDPTAQAGYAQALSAARFAGNELRRNEELFALQLATQSQLDAARKQLQDADSNLAAQKKLGGETGAAKVLAPFDGVVTALTAGQGDRIAAGAPLMQLGRTDILRIQLGIEPAQSRLVSVGMQVSIATIQDTAKTISAKVSEIQNLVDPKTQLVGAIVELPANKAPSLVPGMRIQAVIQLGKNLLWSVPRQAILNDENGAYLFQVAAGKAHRVAVVKLVENAANFGVDGKLDAALPVVVLGNYELQDGMSVREAAR
ncbi:efflux RND transporter periplasmic adaptor subunit [Undibacterium sp.]|jgi:membrane fusion protein (multidrug efflux system)|uniref:efflux RND transporter periplasmic adaptor subunit n=1 Tax=Undibacterium sp. TaxID=1914977 RepID=UPI002CE6CA00|nr:efflux RND transporter periplasmic adaptor subunit [Undibacterium sp.]HTD07188.1 efflux RND transporter periplasmic adaptor subunit [Undibacterium sp.]